MTPTFSLLTQPTHAKNVLSVIIQRLRGSLVCVTKSFTHFLDLVINTLIKYDLQQLNWPLHSSQFVDTWPQVSCIEEVKTVKAKEYTAHIYSSETVINHLAVELWVVHWHHDGVLPWVRQELLALGPQVAEQLKDGGLGLYEKKDFDDLTVLMSNQMNECVRSYCTFNSAFFFV